MLFLRSTTSPDHRAWSKASHSMLQAAGIDDDDIRTEEFTGY
jgi:hypothetical protein